MASVVKEDIACAATQIQVIDRLAVASGQLKQSSDDLPKDQPCLVQYDNSFGELIGTSPTHSLLVTTSRGTNNPFFHEACVFIPAHQEVYVTSSLLQPSRSSNFPTILISRLKLYREDPANGLNNIKRLEWAKMRPPAGVEMPNGGVNYKDGMVSCVQGGPAAGSGGIWFMPRTGRATPMVTNFHGRDFNSVNDVVVAYDGAIWFTDPSYGYEQGFRSKCKLPNQVYRFNPVNGDIRVMADGFGKPNGIAFSPDEKIVYITDTDYLNGDGTKDFQRAATIYAFDIIYSNGVPFLTHRRVFAFAVEGAPDGIKCDVHGNVYSGCGDGVEVWNPMGELIGIIKIPGGVANFCFGARGEMFICAGHTLWRLQLAPITRGALLRI